MLLRFDAFRRFVLSIAFKCLAVPLCTLSAFLYCLAHLAMLAPPVNANNAPVGGGGAGAGAPQGAAVVPAAAAGASVLFLDCVVLDLFSRSLFKLVVQSCLIL